MCPIKKQNPNHLPVHNFVYAKCANSVNMYSVYKNVCFSCGDELQASMSLQVCTQPLTYLKIEFNKMLLL